MLKTLAKKRKLRYTHTIINNDNSVKEISMNYKILLHPYRFAIVAILGEKEATVKELRDKLPDIPQAAMYRSVSKLESAGFIKKISTHKSRGAIEVTYGLNFSLEKMKLDNEDFETYVDAAYAVFLAYVHNKLMALKEAGDIDKLDNQLQDNGKLEFSRFNSTKIHVKKENLEEFASEVENLIKKYSNQEGDSYQLTTFLVPEASGCVTNDKENI